ncbi:hypothetical protein MANES_06G160201v8 [Manihot esculenta]|uniref:Uncharacterized protein n=1 Tax=Manihot esculenta TaxID=3983 RepID=A0ACB7HMW5_MANES|nr:hypothetical protein MANES_06G160201v8 [Manihot esculenta]
MASMEFHLLPIFVLFSVVLSAIAVDKIAMVTTTVERGDISVPAEIYWHSKLSNTSIPRDLLNLIQHVGDKYIFWNMEYGKRYEKKFEQATAEDTADVPKVKYGVKYGKRYEKEFEQATAEDTADVPKVKYGVKYGKRYEKEFEQATAEDTADVPKVKYGVKYGKRYEKEFEQATAEDTADVPKVKYGKRYELKFNKHARSNSIVFFLPNDLHAGKKMRLHITKSVNKARILPRQVADSLPFSTNKLAEIMKYFSVNPESSKGRMLKETVEDCESPGIKGEDRFCPTSLESLVDFSVKHVGNKAQVLMNEIDRPKREQEYTIKEVKFIGENHVVCHKQNYPYAVYYCHALNGTKVYTAQVVGADGTKAKAVAVCHTDTSAWNPGHLAFLVLKTKPGEGTVCHFIRSDTFVMVSN